MKKIIIGSCLLLVSGSQLSAAEYQLYGKLNERYHLRYYDPAFENKEFWHAPEMAALIGVNVEFAEWALLRLELSSAPSNQPATQYRRMDSVFTEPAVNFSSYYLQMKYWRLFQTRIGRAPVQYVGDEILFSRGLTLAGLQQTIGLANFGPFAKIEARGGMDFLTALEDPKSVLYGVQAVLETEAIPLANVVLAFGYYSVSRPGRIASVEGTGGFIGPNSNSEGVKYDILQWHAEVGAPMVPIKILGDYVVNTAASNGQNEGFIVGLNFGHMAQAGAVALQYYYIDLQRDCVISLINSELWRTNLTGHEVGLGYQIIDNLGVSSRLLIRTKKVRMPSLEWLAAVQIAF